MSVAAAAEWGAPTAGPAALPRAELLTKPLAQRVPWVRTSRDTSTCYIINVIRCRRPSLVAGGTAAQSGQVTCPRPHGKGGLCQIEPPNPSASL